MSGAGRLPPALPASSLPLSSSSCFAELVSCGPLPLPVAGGGHASPAEYRHAVTPPLNFRQNDVGEPLPEVSQRAVVRRYSPISASEVGQCASECSVGLSLRHYFAEKPCQDQLYFSFNSCWNLRWLSFFLSLSEIACWRIRRLSNNCFCKRFRLFLSWFSTLEIVSFKRDSFNSHSQTMIINQPKASRSRQLSSSLFLLWAILFRQKLSFVFGFLKLLHPSCPCQKQP